MQNALSKLFVEDMELAKKVEIQIQGNTVTAEINGNILYEICRQTDSQQKAHKQVSCLLSSAIACVLAKSTGKLMVIENKTRNQEIKIAHAELLNLQG